MEVNKIYNEDNLQTMAKMPDNFIDLTITSPPYDELRTYNGFSFDFENIAKELFRITKYGGVVVWVVNDATINGSESLTSFKQTLFFVERCGFKLHDTIIYEKNSMSMPEKNRYYSVFEYMFIFSKGVPKTINLIEDRKNRWAGTSSFGTRSQRQRDGSLKKNGRAIVKDFGVRFNIWRYNTGAGYTTKDKIAFEHPAIFPEKLVADHIRSWSNEGDLIYDCFIGSGTTAKAAHLLNRNWVGSEISKEYCEIANKRLEKYLMQTKLF